MNDRSSEPTGGSGVDFSGFYTDTHNGVDDGARASVAEVAASAAETWRDATALYAYREVIAIGGMGAVLRIWDPRVERDVAMKVMLPPISSIRADRFWREARLTAALTHPNIVAVHEVGLTPLDEPYFTMKLVDGEGLHRSLEKWAAMTARERPPLSARVRIARRVCDAIAYAHERGVQHLDVKPQNVLVGAFGEVIVIDWGVAMIESEDATIDERPAGSVIGTPGFMAPEQAAGRTADLSERTDVYSLGALLYSLVTLKPPLVGDNLEQLLAHNRDGRVVPPHRRADCPLALSRVIMRAMAAEPSARYASVAALVADLDAWSDGRAPTAAGLNAFERTGLMVRRHQGAARVTLFGGLAAAAVLVAGFVRLQAARDRASAGEVAARAAEQLAQQQLAKAEAANREAEHARASAESAAHAAELRFAQQALRQGRREAAAAALQRCASARRRWAWRWLQQGVEQVSWQPVLPSAPSASIVVDGRLAALGASSLYLQDGARLVQQVTAHPYEQLWGGASGQPLVATNATGALGLHDVRSGKQIWAGGSAPVGIAAAVGVGDGQHLLLAVGNQLQLFDFTAGRVVGRFPLRVGVIRCLVAAGDGNRFLVGGADRVVVVFDLQRATVVRRYACESGVKRLLLDLPRRRAAMVGEDGIVRLLNLADGNQTALMSKSVVGAALAPDGDRLALGMRDGSVEVWGMTRLQQLAVLPGGGRGAVRSLGWRGNELVVVSADARLGIWRLLPWPIRLPQALPAGATMQIASGPGGRVVAVAGQRLLLFDPEHPAAPRQLSLPATVVALHAGIREARLLLGDGTLAAVNYATASLEPQRRLATGQVTEACFSPDGRRLAYLAGDGQPYAVADLATGEPVAPDFRARRLLACSDGGDLLLLGHGGVIFQLPPGAAKPGWQAAPIFGQVVTARLSDGGLHVLIRDENELPPRLLTLSPRDGSLLAADVLPAAGELHLATSLADQAVLLPNSDGQLVIGDFSGNELITLDSRPLAAIRATVAGPAAVVIGDAEGSLMIWHAPGPEAP